MKRALIIGINYFGSSCALEGPINDAKNVQGFINQENSIMILQILFY